MNTRIIHFPFGTIIGLAIALLLLVLPIPARTATSEPANITFVVDDQSDTVDNNLGDGVCLTTNAKCTLRAAIQEANAQYAGHPGAVYTISLPGAPTVVSPPTVYSLTIAGSGEDLSATGDLDIKANLVLRTTNGQAALVSASSLTDRVFHIIQPPIGGEINVTFQNIWIAQGVATDGGSDGRIGGGGLLIDSAGSVTLSNGGVLSNTVIVPGTKTGLGAGIFQNTRGGTLTLKNMQVNSNRMLGGDFSVGAGGGVFGFGALLVSDSTIFSNVVTFNPFLGSGTSFSGEGGGIQISCCVGNDSLTLSNTAVLSNAVIVRGPTASAQFAFGGGVYGAAPLTLTHSTVQGNLVLATGNVNNVQGGGVHADGRLLLQTSTVTENRLQTANNASVIFAGGGVRVTSAGRILTSTITRNSIRIGSAFGGVGGGLSAGSISNSANVLVDASSVEYNLAGNGGGIEAHSSDTGLAVRNSVVDNNTGLTGGGILNTGILSLTNSTIYSNLSWNHGGGLYNNGTASVDSVTFNNNTADIDADNAGDGGAIYVLNGATLFLRDSLLTGNTDDSPIGTQAEECFGDIISQDYNLIAQTPSPTGCNVIGSTGHNLIGIFSNVLDFQLLDHGGATGTLALLPGSIAIGAGDPTGCKNELGSVLTKDQRGVSRIGVCDIGAFEYQVETFLPLVKK
jgi:CSLREA domain-containing protein